jgi:hypothetical protein
LRRDTPSGRLYREWLTAWPDERIKFLHVAGLSLDPAAGRYCGTDPAEWEWLATAEAPVGRADQSEPARGGGPS